MGINHDGLSTVGEALEALVDKVGLRAVLGELVTVCGLKAEHIRHAWQDDPLARAWERAGKCIDKAALRVEL